MIDWELINVTQVCTADPTAQMLIVHWMDLENVSMAESAFLNLLPFYIWSASASINMTDLLVKISSVPTNV